MTHTWPTRAEWQAAAESYTRTLCMPYERVPRRADHWLNEAELAETRATAHRLNLELRRQITRTIKTLAPQFPGEPASIIDRYDYEDTLDEHQRADYKRLVAARQDRLQLGRDARLLDNPNLEEGEAAGAGRRINRIATDWGTSNTETDRERLAHLLAAMTERCDTAASEATETAVRAEIAKRATDEGWAKELERRQRIDQARTSYLFR